jgi:hypothetical protein
MCAEDEVTVLLKAMKSGDAAAGEKLLPLVYNEFHRLANQSALMQVPVSLTGPS